MAIKKWPESMAVESADIGLLQDVQRNRARSGKNSTFEMPGASWVMTLTFRESSEWEGRPQIEALITSLRGGANRLLAPHFGRPAPRGSLQGTPRLASTVSPGAGELLLKDCNGTLLAGDFIGLGGQLLMVGEDAVPVDGKMTVSVHPAVRQAQSINALVQWNRPEILWLLDEKEGVRFPYRSGGHRPSFSIRLIEDWI